MPEALFMTQRTKVLEAYKAANQPFTASTKPYKSTVGFTFQAVNPVPNVGAATVEWLVATGGAGGAGVPLSWFSYKIADAVPGNNLAGYRTANEADTNISKARTTNGAEDFVIEGMSCSHRSQRVIGGIPGAATITDVNVINALSGLTPIYDPAALYIPPQIQSPFNLENGMFRYLQPYVSVEFEWDRQRIVKMGTLDQIPEGGANSYLRASGEPSTNNRYRIPEGYIWRREGEPDSEFIVRGTLQDVLAVPVLIASVPVTGTVAASYVPTQVILDVVLRLHGLAVKLPTRN
jgi:hypothetical protein